MPAYEAAERGRGGEAERRADLVAGVHEPRHKTRLLRLRAGERSQQRQDVGL
jgi:hypothetical protein